MANILNFRSCRRIKNKNFCSALRLRGNPQLKGIVLKLVIRTPKKPNSALRHAIRVKLYKNLLGVTVRIPGIGYLPTRYNRVLVRGGRANDVPGIRYTAIRGVYDFTALFYKQKRRSIYGTPRPENTIKHIRRRFRKITFL